MKTIKLAWKVFKFMTLILPMVSFVLEIVATKLEEKNNVK